MVYYTTTHYRNIALFDESSIGLSVDIKGYNIIEYPPLKRHIDESVKILFDFD